MDSNELVTEFTKVIKIKNYNSSISPDDIKSLKNYENRNRDKLKKVSIIKNNNIDDNKLELWCNQYGLDSNTITQLLKQYFSDYKVVKFIYEWVQKYNNYIPYFPEMNHSNNLFEFIFISSYVNYSIANLDDREDYVKTVIDPISQVSGNKILGLLKETKTDRKTKQKETTLTHLIRFDQIYVPAVIPSLIYYLEYNLFRWETKNYYYRTVSPDMIEKYLIPELSTNKEENRKIKVYNNKLLSVLRLLRS
jgi:hypothetical protein